MTLTLNATFVSLIADAPEPRDASSAFQDQVQDSGLAFTYRAALDRPRRQATPAPFLPHILHFRSVLQ
jgi:hypothetical protein